MRPTLFLAMLLACAAADGHGLSLARLDIEPLDDARWLLQWSAPPGSAPPALAVGPDCALQRIDEAAPGRGNGRTAARWETSCSANVRGWTLTANDLPAGLPVIASVAGESAELHAAGEPFVVHVGGSPSVLQVARSYLEAGVVHVMGGADHLLMLLCLALLAVGLRRLLVAATMFTIGHTLTLVATTLGWIRFDARLGELLIACTLAWSAVALAGERRGRGVDGTQLPVAALLFGLVHGLGFASALGAVGSAARRAAAGARVVQLRRRAGAGARPSASQCCCCSHGAPCRACRAPNGSRPMASARCRSTGSWSDSDHETERSVVDDAGGGRRAARARRLGAGGRRRALPGRARRGPAGPVRRPARAHVLFDGRLRDRRAGSIPATRSRSPRARKLTLADGRTQVKLAKPLDFAAVTDHAETFDVMYRCTDPQYLDHPYCAGFREASRPVAPIEAFRRFFYPLVAGDKATLAPICDAAAGECAAARVSQWRRVQEFANAANEPCRFTAFVANEWSATPNGRHWHRNLIFASEKVSSFPINYVDQPTVDALWDALDRECRAESGCDVIAIPHNMNLAEGGGFDVETASDERLRQRMRYERLAEIHQHKGNSECLPAYGIDDTADCDFERMLPPRLVGPGRKPVDEATWRRLRSSYYRRPACRAGS
ncbi:MAG: DUF3604 domain-containing protein [Steroidobacteraceae bacterium]